VSYSDIKNQTIDTPIAQQQQIIKRKEKRKESRRQKPGKPGLSDVKGEKADKLKDFRTPSKTKKGRNQKEFFEHARKKGGGAVFCFGGENSTLEFG